MHRLYITSKVKDSRAEVKKKNFNSLGLKHKIGAVYLADCYTIDARLNNKQLQQAQELLTNPLTQNCLVNQKQLISQFSHAIEISFLAGVTDNAGSTAKETLIDGAKINFQPGQNVYSSQVFFISGKISAAEAQLLASSLHNPLIQKAVILNFQDFQKFGLPETAPKVKLAGNDQTMRVDLNISGPELEILGKQGILDPQGFRRGPLSLGLLELRTIADYFRSQKRNPTDIELEMLAQTWSEHCQHTIFADPLDELKDGIFKTYIKAATDKIRGRKTRGSATHNEDFCVSVFKDNSGAINFNKKYLITHKVETHNTPSALDPFGGAITGIVGVNRDALGFGLGAKPIINVYGFCVAGPTDQTELFRDAKLKNKMLSSRRILDGVVAGINAGGNQSGIPTNMGTVHIHPDYRGKPLVFAGTLGLIPKKIGNKLSHQKQAKPGDLIVMLGGRVGADGIHGATFSSETLDSHSPATAVQIGDPITQKKFSDAIIREARSLNLYNSITDDGAGGLSSSVGEMAKESGGCEVELTQVPLKYPGLSPWQIWISESQERMTLAVPQKNWKKFKSLMERRGVEATIIGKFTNSGNCIIKFDGQIILNLELDFLHHGRPIKNLATKKPADQQLASVPKYDVKNLTSNILQLLSSPNIASTEYITKQYDHEVQGGSVLKPLQGAGEIPANATVTRPDLSSPVGCALSMALYPNYSELDPYAMAACSIDTAIREVVCAGANPKKIALLDNFCWCSSNEPERLWQLKQAARACFDSAVAYGAPFISGKDSMFNDFQGYNKNGRSIKISIPPTLLISALGIVEDVKKSLSLDAKFPGDYIYLLGETNNELGGSAFTEQLGASGKVPQVNLKVNLKTYQNFAQAINLNLVASAQSVGSGGLAVALFKTTAGGNLGAKINLNQALGNWTNPFECLFSESQGRILATVNPKNAAKFEELMLPIKVSKLGTVTKIKNISVEYKKKNILNLSLAKALMAYKSTFKDF